MNKAVLPPHSFQAILQYKFNESNPFTICGSLYYWSEM